MIHEEKFCLDVNHYIYPTSTCVRLRDCESLTSGNYYFNSFVYIYIFYINFAVIH